MKNLNKVSIFIVMIMTLIMSSVFITSAETYNGIMNNGLNGVYIDIYSEPYVSMKKAPVWGQYAYGPQGCAWFATSRIKQLTGKNITNIYSGYRWYHEVYDDFDFIKGKTIRAKALACYGNHVAVVEKVEGNIVTISEGGNTSYPNNDYCVIRQRTISEVESSDFYGYVYLDEKIEDAHEKVFFHSMGVNNISQNDATIFAWTTNNAGEFFSCGFWFGEKDNMQLITTYTHCGWTEFQGSYKISDYYGYLSPGKTYYYKFYLISASDMSYYESDTFDFKTSGSEKLSFGHNKAENQSAINATVSAWCWNNRGLNMSSIGFYIGESTSKMEKVQMYTNKGWSDFGLTANIIDYYKPLKANTTYYCRFYVFADTYYYSPYIVFETNGIYPSYTVNFNSNDGLSSTTSKTVIYNGIYGTLPIPIRPGYSFSGWYTSATGGTKISSSTKVTKEKNHVLYAHWMCNHDNTEIRNGVTATCKVKGYTGDTYCNTCGEKMKTGIVVAVKAHTYSNGCDKECNVCKVIRSIIHSCKTTTIRATLENNGKTVTECSACGTVESQSTIYRPKNIKLSVISYTYNGKTKTPSVTVKDSKGKVLKKGTDYTVTYPKKRKAIGKYTVTVTFKGKYSGTKKLTFEIDPAKTSISKVSAGKKQLTATWKSVSGATGYEIVYSTSKKFTKKTTKTVIIKMAKANKITIKKLKKGKKYYVKVRAYKNVSGKKIYGAYSKVKIVTVK